MPWDSRVPRELDYWATVRVAEATEAWGRDTRAHWRTPRPAASQVVENNVLFVADCKNVTASIYGEAERAALISVVGVYS